MSARPVEQPDNPYRLVSAADCRLMTFETVSEATRLWIKGREFTVGRLLGDAYRGQADKYAGGALAIFRLAPQDYHRFHSPVDGTIGPMTYIAGEYYTVNVRLDACIPIFNCYLTRFVSFYSRKQSELPSMSMVKTHGRSCPSIVPNLVASWQYASER